MIDTWGALAEPETYGERLHGAGIFIYIYPKNDPDVGKYSIHGASGIVNDVPVVFVDTLFTCAS